MADRPRTPSRFGHVWPYTARHGGSSPSGRRQTASPCASRRGSPGTTHATTIASPPAVAPYQVSVTSVPGGTSACAGTSAAGTSSSKDAGRPVGSSGAGVGLPGVASLLGAGVALGGALVGSPMDGAGEPVGEEPPQAARRIASGSRRSGPGWRTVPRCYRRRSAWPGGRSLPAWAVRDERSGASPPVWRARREGLEGVSRRQAEDAPKRFANASRRPGGRPERGLSAGHTPADPRPGRDRPSRAATRGATWDHGGVALTERSRMSTELAGARGRLETGAGGVDLYRLAWLADRAGAPVERLPHTVKILLENLLRRTGSRDVDDEDVLALAGWPGPAREIAFMPGRVL